MLISILHSTAVLDFVALLIRCQVLVYKASSFFGCAWCMGCDTSEFWAESSLLVCMYFILQGAQLFYVANPYDSVLRNLIAVALTSIVVFLNFDKQQSTSHRPVKLEMADGLELNGTTKSTETSTAEAQPYLWL